ncbi:hypothetical protein THOM_3275, partial [Trachipleistophora hominis]
VMNIKTFLSKHKNINMEEIQRPTIFFMLLAMISLISMTHIVQQSMRDDEPVKNTEDAVNKSWGVELRVKSLGNNEFVKKFGAKCYEIVQIVENFQLYFT